MQSRFAVLASIVVLVGACVGSAVATTGPNPYAIVNVRLTDQRITLSKQGVHDVTYVDFLIRNVGTVPHNSRIGVLGSKAVRPGQLVHLIVAFPVYGSYRYRSSLNCTRKMIGSYQLDRTLPPA